MGNKFNETMAAKSTAELLKVIELRADYQPEAVEAAEFELNKRKELLNDTNISEEATLTDDCNFTTLEKFRNSTDDELLEIYKTDFESYSKVELDFLAKELARRNIEPKIWFFSKGNEKKGPLTATELKTFAQKGELDHYDYVWREGLKNWVLASKVENLFKDKNIPPPLSNQRPDWLTDNSKKEKSAGIIIAAIIFFLTVPFWITIAIVQAGYSAISNDTFMGLLSIYNVFFAIASIAMGVGILQLKKWGYRWGVNTAVLNIIWFGYLCYSSNNLLFLYLFLLELTIGILLYYNREPFLNEAEEHIVNI
jgi:hypothetical protein